jgi:hypothetical protein
VLVNVCFCSHLYVDVRSGSFVYSVYVRCIAKAVGDRLWSVLRSYPSQYFSDKTEGNYEKKAQCFVMQFIFKLDTNPNANEIFKIATPAKVNVERFCYSQVKCAAFATLSTRDF